jgi:(p)ppGpp synthase/HD superfamily hydrolase
MPEAPSIDVAVERSPLVADAMEAARGAHRGQVRSASGGLPYIEHPRAVAEELAGRGFDDEVLAAALLHDVVEDSEIEPEDVRRLVGDRVAALVEVLTDDGEIDEYSARKREHRQRVRGADTQAQAIFAADKLTNVRMLRGAYAEQGEDVGDELKVSLDEKIRVWEEDRDMLAEQRGDVRLAALAEELSEELSRLAGDRQRAAERPTSQG